MSEKRDNLAEKTPGDQASSRAGNGGIVPPIEHRWPKGVSGNPAGRPPAGATVREWLNVMQEWSPEEIAKVLADRKDPAAKIAAARIWRDACNEQYTSSGAPVAASDIDRIMDRTEGKPKQSMDVKVDAALTQKSAIQDAMGKVLSDPEAFAHAEALVKHLKPDASEPDHH